MEEFISLLKNDFSKAYNLEKGLQKFSDFLKSLPDERLKQYRELVQICLEGENEEEVQNSVAKAMLVYTYFVSIFEEPGNDKIKMDTKGEWCERMSVLIAFEGMRRAGIFSEVDGSLKGDVLEAKPGVNFEQAQNSLEGIGLKGFIYNMN